MNLSRRAKKNVLPLTLGWSHCGVSYRVTPWPDARFECLYGDDWIEVVPSEEMLASASQMAAAADWEPYLEFLPGEASEFLRQFSFTRMEALQVIVRCPALLPALMETPALTAFVAAHEGLRGTPGPRWEEINAVYERGDIFGLLDWLGLPASRQTLAILHNVADPEVPKRFLEPLRTLLWDPRSIFALQRMSGITDRQLARFCHALAA